LNTYARLVAGISFWHDALGICVSLSITMPVNRTRRCLRLGISLLLPLVLLLRSPPEFATQETSKNPLPTPILVVGMPKTGTTTIKSFFDQGGYNVSHHGCGKKGFCGFCMRQAIQDDLPPLQTCGNFQVYTQMDTSQFKDCHYPQIHNLQQLYDEAPQATWILNRRNATKWAESVQNWHYLAVRMSRCQGGPVSDEEDDLVAWLYQHHNRIRSFVAEHPSLHLIEIDIEDPATAGIMARHFHLNASYWGHQNLSPANETDALQRFGPTMMYGTKRKED